MLERFEDHGGVAALDGNRDLVGQPLFDLELGVAVGLGGNLGDELGRVRAEGSWTSKAERLVRHRRSIEAGLARQHAEESLQNQRQRGQNPHLSHFARSPIWKSHGAGFVLLTGRRIF